MTLEPAQVESRSNSDLLTIKDIALDVSLTAAQRLSLIQRITADWDRSTAGSTGRGIADRISRDRIKHGLSMSYVREGNR